MFFMLSFQESSFSIFSCSNLSFNPIFEKLFQKMAFCRMTRFSIKAEGSFSNLETMPVICHMTFRHF
ncbi:hypothetical Protein YC6258_03900 [Gynuella sunshinyii YC6258]|uniref:Uncharacterized protein n=1 Tax=Gynuella sunshinyii YC6258 TaxID=1445510 RepID=A0A0C5VNP7_9GAMM|nr:hypothetical Protein YC6258_03900 [Gynuella sunshinyii YC6258]